MFDYNSDYEVKQMEKEKFISLINSIDNEEIISYLYQFSKDFICLNSVQQTNELFEEENQFAV